MLEQRKSIRRRTLLDGRLGIEKLNGWVLDCCVRNVSDGGARITVPNRAPIPQTFELGISGREPRPARLVWCGNGQAGVTFDLSTAAVDTSGGAANATGPHAVSDAEVLQARITAIASRRKATNISFGEPRSDRTQDR